MSLRCHSHRQMRHRVPAALAWVTQAPAALHTDSWQALRPAWEHWAVPVPAVHWEQEVMLNVYAHTPDGADPQPPPPPAQQLPLPDPVPQSMVP